MKNIIAEKYIMGENCNIWEALSLEDLVKLLRDNPERFIILGLVLKSTPDRTKRIIKKFFKAKYEEYPNILFIYYCIHPKDIGKISLIDSDTSMYPYMYHIQNIENIFVTIDRANEYTINEAFREVENIYISDREAWMEKQSKIKIKPPVILDKKQLKQQNRKYKESESTEENDENKQIDGGQDLSVPQGHQRKIKNNLVERKKLMDKILILKKACDTHDIEFMKDIQQRKRDEENMK